MDCNRPNIAIKSIGNKLTCPIVKGFTNMSISKRTVFAMACICLAAASSLFAATFTVSKDGRGAYTTIQAAVTAARAGDIVMILDAATYPEQVTIDSTKSGLTLISSAPTSLNKPRVVWQDLADVHPKTYAESQIDSMINFDQNGALRILRAQNVTINGIAIDGGGPYVYGYGCIWSQQNDLVAGNAALTIWVSGGAHILNCDVSNAYWGINFKDRNEGGIFANANPSDIQPQNIVPMSGFGRTGNHVIEYTRIHNNSFGLYFESSWDLGSTIRYNLIFENHHQTAAFAKTVSTSPTGNNCETEGKNQPGGAMMFKDVAYSPLSIYNNTFWHNFLLFVGGWRPGAQHLIFNNIFAKPFEYWSADPSFSNDSYMEMSATFANRMDNCIYACQNQAPQTGYVSIMNGFPQVQGVNGQPPAPGTILSVAAANQAFPVAANVRWIEMDSTRFQSMDPASINFLTPNWNDTLIAKYIKNQGWQASGVKNMDGSVADLGAVSSDGGRPTDFTTIRPTDPVLITGTSATIKFAIDLHTGQFQNPTAKLFRFVSNLPAVANWDPAAVITAANINNITLPAAPALQVGINTYTFTIPVTQTTDYAFFEGIFEGTDQNGKKYTSSTGFLPYRNLNYKFVVQVQKAGTLQLLDTVRVGDTVLLNVIPQKKDGTAFANNIKPVQASLASGFTLYETSDGKALTYPQGITGQTRVPVVFTKVPQGGIEIVSLTGIWGGPNDTEVFQGSAAIRVLPGPPAAVVFQDPPSNSLTLNRTSFPVIPPGPIYNGKLNVYDVYGNIVNTSTQVTLNSLSPNLATVDGTSQDTTITTDLSGVGTFGIQTTNLAQFSNPISIQALLTGKTSRDTTTMTVGKTADHLVIFYGDTASYNPNAQDSGQVGDKLKITIIATKSASHGMDSLSLGRTDTVSVSPSGLVFYSSATATTQTTSVILVGGRATIWVSSATPISNGSITVSSSSLSSVTRSGINFTQPLVVIDSAFYYADNGTGSVNRVEIYYDKKLPLIPDSITLYWPLKSTSTVQTVSGSQLSFAPDSMHLTINLTTPFPPGLTYATSADKLGISYNRPNTAPGVSATATNFAITERVGPLIMSAQVVERLSSGAGTDTMYVTFSEPVPLTSLTGANNALILIKNGATYELSITNAIPITSTRFELTVSSTTAPPQLGDSLRIDAAGPITDSLGNKANALNRPVVISIKTIPAPITNAWYLDKNADGVVDAVRITFAKSVSLSDLVVSLAWGDVNPAYTNTIADSLLSFFGGTDSIIEVNVQGAFKTISTDSIKTSGSMQATVSFISMPEDPAEGSAVTDSAAPVIVSAKYFPGAIGTGAGNSIDTLSVVFSEPISPINSTTPFQLKTKLNATYTLSLVSPLLQGSGPTLRFIVSQIQGVVYPQTGDSLWIDPKAGVADAAGIIQNNPNNRHVVLTVAPIPYSPPKVTILLNPFRISGQIMNGPPEAGAITGTVIEVKPPQQLTGLIAFSASVKIYDILGNAVVKDITFKQSSSTGLLYYNWDGRNFNSRYVGTGAYVAMITVTDSNGKSSTTKLTIGVIR
jgi:hypothetical protein